MYRYLKVCIANIPRPIDIVISIYKKLLAAEQSITDELLSAQGQTIDLGGYYDTQKEKVEIAMRPSPTFTTIIDEII